MDELNLDDLERPRSRWVQVGAVEIHVRYVPPIESDRFRKRLQSEGIARFTKSGRFEENPGREKDFYAALAGQYILGWRGNITGQDTVYTPEKMGNALMRVGPLLDALRKAIEDDEVFFEKNGSGSMPNSTT